MKIQLVHLKQHRFECDHCSFKTSKRCRLMEHFEKIHKFDVKKTTNHSEVPRTHARQKISVNQTNRDNNHKQVMS